MANECTLRWSTFETAISHCSDYYYYYYYNTTTTTMTTTIFVTSTTITTSITEKWGLSNLYPSQTIRQKFNLVQV